MFARPRPTLRSQAVDEQEEAFSAPTGTLAGATDNNLPTHNYKEPEWGCGPTLPSWSLEVIKSGVSIETIPLSSKSDGSKSFYVIGRAPTCDISMEHPSISRFHCVIQFKAEQAFLHDLGSSHGTILNRDPIRPKKFYPIRDGCQIRVGASTRILVVHGPSHLTDSKQDVSQAHVTNVDEDNDRVHKEETRSQKWRQNPVQELRKYMQTLGLSVDFTTFSASEVSMQHSFHDSEDNPKKPQVFVSTIDVPPIGTVTGHGRSKKDSQAHAAMEACEQLMSLGILDEAERNRKEKNRVIKMLEDREDDDYDDTRQTRNEAPVGTYDTLTKKRELVLQELSDVKMRLENMSSKKDEEGEEEDELDAYMSKLTKDTAEKERVQLERRIPTLEKELERIDKLIEIVKPNDLFLKPSVDITPVGDNVHMKEAPRIASLPGEGQAQAPHEQRQQGTKRKTSPELPSSPPKRRVFGASLPPPPQLEEDLKYDDEEVVDAVAHESGMTKEQVNKLKNAYGY